MKRSISSAISLSEIGGGTFAVFRKASIRIALLLMLSVWHSLGQSTWRTNPCNIKSLTRSAIQGVKVYSPDGTKFLINQPDNNNVYQIYIGNNTSSRLTCITCTQQPRGPKPDRSKMQPHWHPSGKWIFLSVERDQFSPPPILGLSSEYIEGELQAGLWTNMYVVSPDGTQWYQLTNFQSGVTGVADGFTGPAITSDGTKIVWSQIIDGNIFVYYPFGRWQLIMANFNDQHGTPTLSNQTDITPAQMYWNEPGNFAPDNQSLLLTGSTNSDAEGMDQYILNIRNGGLINLTQSPTVWDEHGVFSPDGQKILFMSSYPYRSDPTSYKVSSLKAEFMLMNKDGSNLTQLTHFEEPGYPEYSANGGIAASAEWTPDGRSANLRRLFFPGYEYWDIVFGGACGNTR